MGQSTPGKGYTDILPPRLEKQASNEAQLLHSIYIVLEGKEPKISVTQDFVYQCAALLTDFFEVRGESL